MVFPGWLTLTCHIRISKSPRFLNRDVTASRALPSERICNKICHNPMTPSHRVFIKWKGS
jgi:hypothetical protein